MPSSRVFKMAASRLCLHLTKYQPLLVQSRLLHAVVKHGVVGIWYRDGKQQAPALHTDRSFHWVQRRCFFTNAPIRPMNKEDGMPDDQRMIYFWQYRRHLVAAYYILGLTSVPIVLNALHVLGSSNGYVMYFDETQMLAVLGAPFMLALLAGIKFIMSRVFIRIYYHQDSGTFTGLCYSGKPDLKAVKDFYLHTNQMKFSHMDILDPQRDGTFTMNGKTFWVKDEDFVSPRYYNIFMGYEKHRK